MIEQNPQYQPWREALEALLDTKQAFAAGQALAVDVVKAQQRYNVVCDTLN